MMETMFGNASRCGLNWLQGGLEAMRAPGGRWQRKCQCVTSALHFLSLGDHAGLAKQSEILVVLKRMYLSRYTGLVYMMLSGSLR